METGVVYKERMPFVPTASVISVELIYLVNTQLVENVWNVLSGTTPVDEAALDRIKAKFETWRVASLRPRQSTQCSAQKWVLRDLTSEASFAKEYAVTANAAGSFAQNALPQNVTASIKYSTGLAGRSYRGRTFHVGLSLGQYADNRVNTGEITSLTTCYTALLTGLAGGGTVDTLVVLSKWHDGSLRSAGVATPITGVTVDPNLDSQRRRLNTRGS